MVYVPIVQHPEGPDTSSLRSQVQKAIIDIDIMVFEPSVLDDEVSGPSGYSSTGSVVVTIHTGRRPVT